MEYAPTLGGGVRRHLQHASHQHVLDGDQEQVLVRLPSAGLPLPIQQHPRVRVLPPREHGLLPRRLPAVPAPRPVLPGKKSHERPI